MNKKFNALLFTLCLVFYIGCGKSAEKSIQEKAASPKGAKKKIALKKSGKGDFHKGAPGEHPKTKERRVEVSKEVQELWKEGKIFVKNKKTGDGKVYTVPLHSELKIPNSKLIVKVGYFVPDFSMAPGVISSTSKELTNPALQVTVFEGKKKVYGGWLFSRFPDMHPFEHSQYSISLAEEMFKKVLLPKAE